MKRKMESKVVKILVMSIFIVVALIESFSASAGGINTMQAYSYGDYYDYDYYDYYYDYSYSAYILESLVVIWLIIWLFDLLFSNDSL